MAASLIGGARNRDSVMAPERVNQRSWEPTCAQPQDMEPLDEFAGDLWIQMASVEGPPAWLRIPSSYLYMALRGEPCPGSGGMMPFVPLLGGSLSTT